jgi:hypothetical protein
MNTRTTLFAFSCLCTLGSMSQIAHAERVIDNFSAPLPQNTLPGNSSPGPVLWAGSAAGSSRWTQSVPQTNLSGVIGGARDTTVQASTLSNFVTLSSTRSGGQYALGYSTGTGTSGQMLLEYGANADLNANLIADGSVAFELQINGDMDSIPNRPVTLTVTAASNGGSTAAVAHVTLINDGVYQIPFSSFAGVNFADIDYLSFEFDASSVSAIDYSLIGGLRTTRCLQPSGSAVADIFLDTFVAPFPVRPMPSVGSVPILWDGTLNAVTKANDSAAQPGLSGVIGGQRNTTMTASSLSNFITAVMSGYDGTPELAYSTGYPTSGSLLLDYGAQSNLNANLSHAVAFELELSGDLDSSPPRPVPLTVTVVSSAGAATKTVTLQNDGMVYIPFNQFPGVNFADVDRVKFFFDASNVQAVDYALVGGLRASACMP